MFQHPLWCLTYNVNHNLGVLMSSFLSVTGTKHSFRSSITYLGIGVWVIFRNVLWNTLGHTNVEMKGLTLEVSCCVNLHGCACQSYYSILSSLSLFLLPFPQYRTLGFDMMLSQSSFPDMPVQPIIMNTPDSMQSTTLISLPGRRSELDLFAKPRVGSRYKRQEVNHSRRVGRRIDWPILYRQSRGSFGDTQCIRCRAFAHQPSYSTDFRCQLSQQQPRLDCRRKPRRNYTCNKSRRGWYVPGIALSASSAVIDLSEQNGTAPRQQERYWVNDCIGIGLAWCILLR